MKINKTWPLTASIAIALLVSATSFAWNLTDRDTQEIAHYVLTDAALAKYTQAIKNLSAPGRKMPGDCDDSEEAKSLDDMVAHFNSFPGAQAAIKSAGLSTREYLVFTMSIFQNGMAAWALSQPGGKLPAGTSMANVTFYRAHEAAIKKLTAEIKATDCGSGEDHQEGDSNE
jgi:hypothetical protein